MERISYSIESEDVSLTYCFFNDYIGWYYRIIPLENGNDTVFVFNDKTTLLIVSYTPGDDKIVISSSYMTPELRTVEKKTILSFEDLKDFDIFDESGSMTFVIKVVNSLLPTDVIQKQLSQGGKSYRWFIP